MSNVWIIENLQWTGESEEWVRDTEHRPFDSLEDGQAYVRSEFVYTGNRTRVACYTRSESQHGEPM